MQPDNNDIESIHSSALSEAPTESSPLLPDGRKDNKYKNDNDDGSWSGEVRWLVDNSTPIVGTYLLQYSLQLASVFTLGHLGPTELAASALASMFASVSAWSIALGTATALDTLCSQAWTGARDKTLVGVHLQRALVILAMIFFGFVVPIWWNATRVLLALNQEPELADLAGLFLRYLLLGAPAFIAFEALKKYLQAQGIMHASTYVVMIASPLNFVINYTLVHVEPVRLGFIGAPIATSLSYWLMFILLVLYTWKVQGKEAWGGWSAEALKNWGPFLRLAVPGALMICSEWWAYQLTALATSYLGRNNLAAQSILLTAVATSFQIPFAISVASANRVGNSLGECFALKAKRASIISLIVGVAFGLLNCVFFISTRSVLGYLFTADEEVVMTVSQIIPYCALFVIGDSLNGISAGVIRGLGHQKIAAFINICSNYVLALPMAYALTFHAGWGLIGIWVGLSIAMHLSAVGQSIYCLTVNWDAEVQRITYIVKAEEVRIHDTDEGVVGDEISSRY
ncbi:mate-domain-containing protein [Zychaea mexicana]|uniref:mate-domain-containing protein n=1 Tax=Zychaea mexicana TaxID=64656 RepID=UPI0022FF3DDC|nr:mate-domain-containing protein [Zychaea mexicana]KAI9497640.1 mate-domain-containing protein [Zychaea mexicana]